MCVCTCNVAATLFLWLVTVTSPYRYRVQYIRKQRAVKDMIGGNTALLHIGNLKLAGHGK